MPYLQGYLTLCPLPLKHMPAQAQYNLICTALKYSGRVVLSGWLRRREEGGVQLEGVCKFPHGDRRNHFPQCGDQRLNALGGPGSFPQSEEQASAISELSHP